MKTSLQNPRLATKCKFILKNNKRHKYIKNNENLYLNIKTFENRNKVYPTQWRTIYKVIGPVFFK